MPRADSAITASALGIPCAASVGALERVDRDVDLRRRAVADLLAVVEHRRLVLLALPDHHDAVHPDRVEHVAHAVDRGLVGRLLVAPADQRRGRQGGGLGDADELEREVAVGQLGRWIWVQGAPFSFVTRATHSFWRSLQRLDLAETRLGRFRL